MEPLRHWGQLRILLAGLLALFAALVIVYGVLAIRTWEKGGHNTKGIKVYTEQEKLQILAGLSGTATTSEKQKSNTLHSVSSSSSSKTSPSEEEKLKILQSLHGK